MVRGWGIQLIEQGDGRQFAAVHVACAVSGRRERLAAGRMPGGWRSSCGGTMANHAQSWQCGAFWQLTRKKLPSLMIGIPMSPPDQQGRGLFRSSSKELP